MDTDENIESALALLRDAIDLSGNPPAIIRLAPDSNAYVTGNRSGYIRLAIASLKAAQGHSQDFTKTKWVGTQELDWCLPGLEYDENADAYLESTKTRGVRVINGIFLVVLLTPFVIGLGTIISWLIHIF